MKREKRVLIGKRGVLSEEYVFGGRRESFALVLESIQEERQSDWLRRERECFRAVRSLEDVL